MSDNQIKLLCMCVLAALYGSAELDVYCEVRKCFNFDVSRIRYTSHWTVILVGCVSGLVVLPVYHM